MNVDRLVKKGLVIIYVVLSYVVTSLISGQGNPSNWLTIEWLAFINLYALYVIFIYASGIRIAVIALLEEMIEDKEYQIKNLEDEL